MAVVRAPPRGRQKKGCLVNPDRRGERVGKDDHGCDGGEEKGGGQDRKANAEERTKRSLSNVDDGERATGERH